MEKSTFTFDGIKICAKNVPIIKVEKKGNKLCGNPTIGGKKKKSRSNSKRKSRRKSKRKSKLMNDFF